MPTLDLKAPGATPLQVARGLAAAGDVLRESGMAPEFVQAGCRQVEAHRGGRQHLPPDAWHWRAAEIFERAQRAAIRACYGVNPDAPADSELMIVQSKGPASFTD